jgi:hypothetical protein
MFNATPLRLAHFVSAVGFGYILASLALVTPGMKRFVREPAPIFALGS